MKKKFTQWLMLIHIGKPEGSVAEATGENDKDGSGGNPKNKYCIHAIAIEPTKTIPIRKSMYGFNLTKKRLSSGYCIAFSAGVKRGII